LQQFISNFQYIAKIKKISRTIVIYRKSLWKTVKLLTIISICNKDINKNNMIIYITAINCKIYCNNLLFGKFYCNNLFSRKLYCNNLFLGKIYCNNLLL